MPRPKNQVGHFVVENRLLALRFVQRVNQRKGLVVLGSERAHGLAVHRILRGLCRREAGRENPIETHHGNIQRQMMAAELQHPGVLHGRLA